MTPPARHDDTARRKRMIDSAEQEFLRDGYHAATMDRIAARAGMSKKTLYQVFPTKEALFRAMVVDRRTPLLVPVPAEGREPADVLTEVLLRAAEFLTARRQMAMCRLVVADSIKSPRLARAFLESIHEPGVSALELGLVEIAARGIIVIGDPHDTAEMLFGFALGAFHMRMLIGHAAAPARPVMEARIRLAVSSFLRGMAPVATD